MGVKRQTPSPSSRKSRSIGEHSRSAQTPSPSVDEADDPRTRKPERACPLREHPMSRTVRSPPGSGSLQFTLHGSLHAVHSPCGMQGPVT
jgi:hypothetical protein